MIIKNGKVFIGKTFQDVDVAFDEKITAIGTVEGEADFDAQGCYVIPGLVDIHTHGAMGEDFSDGKPEGMQPMADYYAAHGVTSYLATTMKYSLVFIASAPMLVAYPFVQKFFVKGVMVGSLKG